jgi:hypothetical protein
MANELGFTSAQIQIPAPNSIDPPEGSDILIGEEMEHHDPDPLDEYIGDPEAQNALLSPGDMAHIQL